MAPRQVKSDPNKEAVWWLGFSKLLLLTLFAVLLYWLGHSMVLHRFFRGGAQNYRMSSGRP